MVHGPMGSAGEGIEWGSGRPSLVVHNFGRLQDKVQTYAAGILERGHLVIDTGVTGLTDTIKAVSPAVDVLKDPKILVTESLRNQVLQNSEHARIPNVVLDAIKAFEQLEKARVEAPLQERLNEAIKHGKLAIGTHFALKKLSKIEATSEAATKRDIADECLKKMGSKGLVVAPAVQKAIAAYTNLKKK